MWGEIIGGAIGAVGSLLSSGAQSDAAKEAGRASQAQYEQTRTDLEPWREAGQVSLDELMYLLGLSPRGAQGQAPTREQYTSQVPSGAGPLGLTPGAQPLDPSQPRGRPSRAMTSSFDEAGYNKALQEYEASQKAASGDPRYGSLTRPFSLADFRESPAYQFNLQQGEEAINKSAAAKGNYYAPKTLQDVSKYSQGLASNEFQNAYSNYNTNMNNIWNRLYGISSGGQAAANQTGAYGAQAAANYGNATMAGGDARAAGIAGAFNNIGTGIQDAYNAYLQEQVLGRNQTPTYK